MTPDVLGAWVIKCNPRRTPVQPMRAAGAAKRDWCVADNYRSHLMRPGQRVLFWVTTDRRRGIWGAGQVAGPVFVGDGRLHVPVHIPLFPDPLAAAELLSVPALQAMEMFRSPQQANPSWVTKDELTHIDSFIHQMTNPGA